MDEDFKKDAEYLHPYLEGPYYAIRQDPGVTTTIGGIDVNFDNEVIDEKGDAVGHLFAIGTDACKLYEETYNYGLSGGMVSYCIYSGRNAAQKAIEQYC